MSKLYVKLINDDGLNPCHPIKRGKIYEVFGFYKDNIEIIRDNGTIFGYKKERFEIVKEGEINERDKI